MNYNPNLLDFNIVDICYKANLQLKDGDHAHGILFKLGKSSGQYRLIHSRLLGNKLTMIFTATFLQKDSCLSSASAVMSQNFHDVIYRAGVGMGQSDSIKWDIPHNYECIATQVERIADADKRGRGYLSTCECFLTLTFTSRAIPMQLVKAGVEAFEL